MFWGSELIMTMGQRRETSCLIPPWPLMATLLTDLYEVRGVTRMGNEVGSGIDVSDILG